MDSNTALDCEKSVFEHWKTSKINAWDDFMRHFDTAFITLPRFDQLSNDDVDAITAQCRKTNICFYRCSEPPTTLHLLALGERLGLAQPLDNPEADDNLISTITTTPHTKYIPYSNRPLQWHTDGYYNSPERCVQSFIMHCEVPAHSGGANAYFDSDMLYILLRSIDEQHITTLRHPCAMTIPANDDDGRRQQSNAVFDTDNDGNLIMRYTQRKQHVFWYDDCQPALQHLNEILDNNQRFRLNYRLNAGEGIICNNIVHRRNAFTDDVHQKRLIYRMRYTRRIARTHWSLIQPDHSLDD